MFQIVPTIFGGNLPGLQEVLVESIVALCKKNHEVVGWTHCTIKVVAIADRLLIILTDAAWRSEDFISVLHNIIYLLFELSLLFKFNNLVGCEATVLIIFVNSVLFDV